MDLISIIMPLYNGEKYLRQCIDSILSQTVSDWELIIVNDGSVDSSLEICSSYAQKDSRIKVITQENAGVSAARNNALAHASGKYVAFIDCDDMYTPDHLEVLLDLLKSNPQCDCAFSEYYEFTGEKAEYESCEAAETKIIPHDEYVDSVLLYQKLNSVWKYMLKAETAKKISFNALKFCEDYFYLLEYAKTVENAAYTSKKLYYYRKDNTASMTQNIGNRKYLNNYITIPKLVYNYISENGLTGDKYRYKLAREYAYSSMRVKRTVSYKEFKSIMNDREYRNGLSYARFDVNNRVKGFIFLLVKCRIYLPFIFLK